VVFYPVKVSTPGPDGSVVHTVQPGQTLWTIAAIYKIQLPELLQLNGLGDNAFIHPGDKLVIKPAKSGLAKPSPADAGPADAGPLSAEMQSETDQIPSATDTPTYTPTAMPGTAAALLQPAQSSLPSGWSGSQPGSAATPAADPLLIIIAVLVVGGTALLIVGSLLKRREEA
jgi:LysM repeat protein